MWWWYPTKCVASLIEEANTKQNLNGMNVVCGWVEESVEYRRKIENRIKKPIMLYTNLYTHILNLNASNLNICSKYLLNLFNPILDFPFVFFCFSPHNITPKMRFAFSPPRGMSDVGCLCWCRVAAVAVV